MMQANSEPQIILASKSPRRKYLLEKAGLSIAVIPSRFDETTVAMTAPDAYVRTLAEAKAAEIAGRFAECWVIGADTIVTVDGDVLGKPASASNARRMLQQLSGRVHQVYTGFCICCRQRRRVHSDVVKTDVWFKELTEAEINWYIQTGEPFDKAGAYAIQGIGTFLVKRIEGSYTNVVGLPVCEVIEFLIKEKVIGFSMGSIGQNSGISP